MLICEKPSSYNSTENEPCRHKLKVIGLSENISVFPLIVVFSLGGKLTCQRIMKGMNVKNVVVTLLLLIVSGMQQAVALDVVFRCDDLTLRGDSVSDRIVSLFIAYDVPLSVAVVPCDSHEQPFELGDVAYVQKLKNPLVEVCMHGYTHENFGGG